MDWLRGKPRQINEFKWSNSGTVNLRRPIPFFLKTWIWSLLHLSIFRSSPLAGLNFLLSWRESGEPILRWSRSVSIIILQVLYVLELELFCVGWTSGNLISMFQTVKNWLNFKARSFEWLIIPSHVCSFSIELLSFQGSLTSPSYGY